MLDGGATDTSSSKLKLNWSSVPIGRSSYSVVGVAKFTANKLLVSVKNVCAVLSFALVDTSVCITSRGSKQRD